MNKQRELFYVQRKKVLEGENVHEDIFFMIEKEIERITGSYISPEMKPVEYIEEELELMIKAVHSVFPQLSSIKVEDIKSLNFEEVCKKLTELATKAYRKHEDELVAFHNDMMQKMDGEAQIAGSKDNVMRMLERDVLLRIIDSKWIDHLHNNDLLREGIGLRAYGQKDPLIEYKREAFDMFNNMMHEIQRETVAHLFRTKFEVQVVQMQEEDSEVIHTDLSKAAENFVPPSDDDNSPVKRADKVGRNDPCPCGSGQKFKKCCGMDRSKPTKV